MTFWNGPRIKSRGRAIIDIFDPSHIDCSSYTLSMGSEAYVTRDPKKSPWDDRKVHLQKQGADVPHAGCFGRVTEIAIPPGQFAFLLTEEMLEMPKDVMGFISLKSSYKFRGLINVSGFHVDPGFNGRLVYAVYNAGPNIIYISRGDKLFLLWFADLSGDDQNADDKTKYYKTGKTQNMGFIPLRQLALAVV